MTTPEERARPVVAAIYRHIGVDSYSADEPDPKATALIVQAIREAEAVAHDEVMALVHIVSREAVLAERERHLVVLESAHKLAAEGKSQECYEMLFQHIAAEDRRWQPP